MKVTKQTVEEILRACGEALGSQDISTPENHIDFDKLEKNEIFKAQILVLKLLGVNGEWLRRKGFMAAFMLLAKYLN